jgi:Type II secretion system (T2SS), protein E, N-terminal domain
VVAQRPGFGRFERAQCMLRFSTMKLGEMLVRDGRLTEEQIERAVASQQQTGGRFGTVLFEMGAIDLDALTVYLGLELGIPIATGAMLERAKRAAVRLLLPEQAFRYKCVPLIVQDRQLIAAIDEPHDLDTLDALARITGYRIIPRVAAEVRIYYYIERYYGMQRPARFLRLGDSPRGDGPPTAALPAPPLPGLPPMSHRPVAAPRPAQAVRFGRAPTPLPIDLAEDLTLEASDMLEELTADATAPAETAPVSAPRLDAQPVQDATITQRIWVPINAAHAVEVINAAVGGPSPRGLSPRRRKRAGRCIP